MCASSPEWAEATGAGWTLAPVRLAREWVEVRVRVNPNPNPHPERLARGAARGKGSTRKADGKAGRG